MKRRAFFTVAVSAVVLACLLPSIAAAGRVEICHIPDDDPTRVRAITVGEASAAAHFANHGDFYDIAGFWSGIFYQPGFEPYTINLEVTTSCSAGGGVIASVSYPYFDQCDGTWTLEAGMGDALVVEEHFPVPYPVGGCLTSCRYTIVYDPYADTLSLSGAPGTNCSFDTEEWSATLERNP